MKKVLVITYYWPPSGGAGVQRWLKLSKYLARSGAEVHILSVEESDASYPVLDRSLVNDIDHRVYIHKSKARNYFKYYELLVGKKNVPKAGYSNVDALKLTQRIVSKIRSHLFIPDPRKGWNRSALVKALEVIEKFKISNVITTSPPHSTQLIGLELKSKRPDINWIADFRDPWTDIYYYNLLGHSKYSKGIDKYYESNVLEKADVITTVSNGFKEIFLSKKGLDLKSEKIRIITNGFDPDDFAFNKAAEPLNRAFCVTYTGTISDQYAPEVFFDVIQRVQTDFSGICQLKIVGTLSPTMSAYADSIGVEYEYIAQVPHDEVVLYQQQSNLLLLIVPDIGESSGIIPGKIFEYLASGTPILVIGPKNGDVDGIIKDTEAGAVFTRDEQDEIYVHIKNLIAEYLDGKDNKIPEHKIQKYSRLIQAEQFMELLT